MQEWNGIYQHYHYKNPDGLLVDADGNIYYTSADGTPALWCIAERLGAHLHRLWQVTNGSAVANQWER